MHALRVVLGRSEAEPRPSSTTRLGQLPFCRHNGQRPRSNARPHVRYIDPSMVPVPNCRFITESAEMEVGIVRLNALTLVHGGTVLQAT